MLGLLLAGLLVAGGCAARQEPAAGTRSALAAAWAGAGARNVVGPPAGRPGPVATAAAPVRIEIPSIGVAAPMDPLGLNADNTMEVPADFARTAWYTGRSAPGGPGPSVVVGHVDSKRGPAAFYRLRDLRPGDEVVVVRSDSSRVVFVVERSKRVPKNAFPTDEVYGPTPEPTLRLITCGGSFDRKAGHYRDNTIVFLHLKG
jgi:sortase (surface protein transpeptidase)